MRKITIFCLAALSAVTLAACGSMRDTAVTPSEFESAAQKWGCTVTDNTDTLEGYEDSVMAYEEALLTDDGSGITYVLFTDSEYAGQYYQAAKEYAESMKGDRYSSKDRKDHGSRRYTQTSDGIYYAAMWSGNTCIYARVDEEYKDVINDFMDELGY